MCWTYLYQYAESIGIDNQSAVTYGISALVIFLVGRWVGTALLKYVNSGKLLFYFSIGAMICTAITIFVTGMIGLYAFPAVWYSLYSAISLGLSFKSQE